MKVINFDEVKDSNHKDGYKYQVDFINGETYIIECDYPVHWSDMSTSVEYIIFLEKKRNSEKEGEVEVICAFNATEVTAVWNVDKLTRVIFVEDEPKDD